MSDIKRVVLAYSGGLDTSVILKWLQVTYNCEVVTFTADLGQGEELGPARHKAELMGVKAEHIYIDDLREEFVRDFVFPMMRANARYEGDYLLGTSIARPSPKNQKFVKDFAADNGTKLRPSYFAVTAYDAMAAIDLALAKTKGDTAGDKFMDALKGLSFESPRGPVEIDPATRDIVQTVYIRKTERVNGQLVNVEFDKFDRVKDPAKEAAAK